MTRIVELDVAQNTLRAIIAQLKPDDVVVIVQDRKPVARLIASGEIQPRFGNCEGLLTIVEEDDDHLKDFENYLP
jgi:uncharacterized protein YbjT (DUF2867 family)